MASKICLTVAEIDQQERDNKKGQQNVSKTDESSLHGFLTHESGHSHRDITDNWEGNKDQSPKKVE